MSTTTTTTFPPVTLADWQALVDKELAGRAFEKALVHEAMAGIRIAPLYTDAPPQAEQRRELGTPSFRICVRPEKGNSVDQMAAEVAEGADALWLPLEDLPPGLLERPELAPAFLILDVTSAQPEALINTLINKLIGAESATSQAQSGRRFALGFDPLARRAAGQAGAATLQEDLAALGRTAQLLEQRCSGAAAAVVSTLPYHDAGADAADELAFALSTGVCYLGALLDAGLTPDQAARQIALRVAVGRDTFVELCKLRALRVCWRKILTASGAGGSPRTLVHAVCSHRTLTVRDPWVNMLRTTTQLFAAVLGGAELVTPTAFDEAFGAPAALGRRIARNTGLVLREESALGQVLDPAGGSYYFETLTDSLAREAWRRFQKLEQAGGIAAGLASGQIARQLESAWQSRLEQLAKRKAPILGTSEFANLDETLPQPPPPAQAPVPSEGALPVHRDAAAFEELRLLAESGERAPEALLVTLGTFAESRARVGFAVSFFAAGGIRTRESAADASERADLVCICGTDERYAAEAAERVRLLKAAGCQRVLVAGRPGALEKSLREAGVDGFIFVGCDVVATLRALLETRS